MYTYAYVLHRRILDPTSPQGLEEPYHVLNANAGGMAR